MLLANQLAATVSWIVARVKAFIIYLVYPSSSETMPRAIHYG